MSKGNGGLSGVKKRSSKKLIVGIIIVVVLAVAGMGTIIFLNEDTHSSYSSIYIYWDTVSTESAWLVKVIEIKKVPETQHDVYLEELALVIRNKSTGVYIKEYLFTELDNTSSPIGITFVDLNDNGIVEIGDHLYIEKSNGGVSGIEINNDDLVLSDLGSTIWFYPSHIVNLPPDDFLDMDVEKTSDGWNVTVTYVNETIPKGLLSDYNVSFRLENQSGIFLTNGTPAWSSYVPEEYRQVSLNLIDNYWDEIDSSHY